MEAILNELKGKKVDVNCGSNVAYRGEVQDVANGILRLVNDEDQLIYISIDKIASLVEFREFGSRPGFIV